MVIRTDVFCGSYNADRYVRALSKCVIYCTITFSMCCVPSKLKEKKKVVMPDNSDEVLLK